METVAFDPVVGPDIEVGSEAASSALAPEEDLVTAAEKAISGVGPWNWGVAMLNLGQGLCELK